MWGHFHKIVHRTYNNLLNVRTCTNVWFGERTYEPKNFIRLSFRSELYKSKIILQLRAAVRFQISVRHQINVINIY